VEAIGSKSSDGTLMQGLSQKDEQVSLQNALEAIDRKSLDGMLMQGVSQKDEQVLLLDVLESNQYYYRDGKNVD